MDKLVEKAAVEAEGRMAQGSVPQVGMREDQQQFAATSGVGAKMDKEPVTTEADIIAPASGTRVGDRVVGSTPEKTKKTKKTKSAPSVKVSSRRIYVSRVYWWDVELLMFLLVLLHMSKASKKASNRCFLAPHRSK